MLTFYKEERFKESPIGTIPEDWEVVRLEKVVRKIKAGGTPSTKNKEYWNGDIPFVKIEDVTSSSKYLSKTAAFISKKGLENSSAWIVPENSLLLAMYGSLGELAINKIPVATNQAILGIIPDDKCDLEFLYYWFLYFKPNWRRYAKPTTQANLTAEIVRNILIPLPPLPERQKIAEILSTVDQAIQKTDEIITKTERLKKGLMQELLSGRVRIRVEDGRIGFYRETQFKDTEIGKVPEDWEVVKLENAGKIVNGFAFPVKYQGKKDGKYIFVKVSDTNLTGNEKYLTTAENTIDDELARKLKVRIYPPGTIIFPKIGMVIYLRKVRILAKAGTFDNNLMGIIPNREKIDPEYLYYYFLERIDLTRLAGRTTAPSIRRTDVANVKIARPPLPEQQKIAEILLTVDKKLEIERKEKERLERIKSGLMDVLLTGKVRVRV